jgi:hypothetical protein
VAAFLGFVIPNYFKVGRLGADRPVIMQNLRAQWVDDTTFETDDDGVEYTRTCPQIWIGRFAMLRDGTTVPLEADGFKGPLTGVHRPPRFPRSIREGLEATTRFRMRLPNTDMFGTPITRRDVALFLMTQRVPDTRPCSDGWSGLADPYQITIDGGTFGNQEFPPPMAGHMGVAPRAIEDGMPARPTDPPQP